MPCSPIKASITGRAVLSFRVSYALCVAVMMIGSNNLTMIFVLCVAVVYEYSFYRNTFLWYHFVGVYRGNGWFFYHQLCS